MDHKELFVSSARLGIEHPTFLRGSFPKNSRDKAAFKEVLEGSEGLRVPSSDSSKNS